jgi:hypothetical protein
MPSPLLIMLVHHQACSNGLALHLTQYNGQGLDHLGWHDSINYHAQMQWNYLVRRRDDKALYCGSLYLSTYTPILCCDFLSITGNFGVYGNSQDSRTQFSPLGWPKKVLIMFPATFSLLFYWFRWLNWTKNIYRFHLHFLLILELIPCSSNSRFRLMVRT